MSLKKFLPAFFLFAGMTPIFGGCTSSMFSRQDIPVSAVQTDSLNPLFVETQDIDYLWTSIVDVIDDHFPIPRENPIREYKTQLPDGTVNRTMTEGRLDTGYVIAAGVLEPWKKNSANMSQRLEATFQTIRRRAVVRAVPDRGGFLIYLSVYNELENPGQPILATTTGTNLQFTDDLSQLELPNAEDRSEQSWILAGRNTDLEQQLLQQIAWRLENSPSILKPRTSADLVP